MIPLPNRVGVAAFPDVADDGAPLADDDPPDAEPPDADEPLEDEPLDDEHPAPI